MLTDIILGFFLLIVTYVGGRWVGAKGAKKELNKKNAEIIKKQEKAYEEIDNRTDSVNSLVDRLRQGDF